MKSTLNFFCFNKTLPLSKSISSRPETYFSRWQANGFGSKKRISAAMIDTQLTLNPLTTENWRVIFFTIFINSSDSIHLYSLQITKTTCMLEFWGKQTKAIKINEVHSFDKTSLGLQKKAFHYLEFNCTKKGEYGAGRPHEHRWLNITKHFLTLVQWPGVYSWESSQPHLWSDINQVQ